MYINVYIYIIYGCHLQEHVCVHFRHHYYQLFWIFSISEKNHFPTPNESTPHSIWWHLDILEDPGQKEVQFVQEPKRHEFLMGNDAHGPLCFNSADGFLVNAAGQVLWMTTCNLGICLPSFESFHMKFRHLFFFSTGEDSYLHDYINDFASLQFFSRSADVCSMKQAVKQKRAFHYSISRLLQSAIASCWRLLYFRRFWN